MDVDPSLPWRQVRGEGFSRLVGPIRFARAGDNLWHAGLEIEDRHLNVGGVCHGGVLLTLADVAMGTASHEAADGHGCATIEFGSHFLAAVKKGQTALAVVHQARRARDLSFMAAEIHAGGRLCVRASGIWKYRASARPVPSGQPRP
ncbi:MAG TPA: PaaI family thioesterase [Thermohalobaculum sp.]|nr:PaaI family thioesterase [Thermohalobaculum sp.]